MSSVFFVLDGINPEPWTSPDVAVGRNRRTGKSFPIVHKSKQLDVYQKAVKEAFHAAYPDYQMIEAGSKLAVRFYLWRQRSDYTTDAQRRARKHDADATNMQKALEDALQDVLFYNDRDNIHVSTDIMEQGAEVHPCIVIEVDLDYETPDITVLLPDVQPALFGEERASVEDRSEFDVGAIF